MFTDVFEKKHRITILYEYPNDRYIQHCYKNNNGKKNFVMNMGR